FSRSGTLHFPPVVASIAPAGGPTMPTDTVVTTESDTSSPSEEDRIRDVVRKARAVLRGEVRPEPLVPVESVRAAVAKSAALNDEQITSEARRLVEQQWT